MDEIGKMAMPEFFPYRDVYLKGRPQHDKYDPFRIKHPQMPNSRRAKIFSPFDALRGFNEAVAAKNVQYEDRMSLSPEDQEELDRRFHILHSLTAGSRMAAANRVQVSVTYFEVCRDENHEACGSQGLYKTVTGICRNVDAEITRSILVDGTRIPMEDIRTIEASGDIFKRNWEDQSSNWDE